MTAIATPHVHEHQHGDTTHSHAHIEHAHQHVEHAHDHAHGAQTHAHEHVHQVGLENIHADA